MDNDEIHVCGDFHIDASVMRQILADAKIGVDNFYRISNAMNRAKMIEIVKCKECIWSMPMEEFPRRHEAPYKYYRSDIRFCVCEDLLGDEPIAVTPDFFCAYGRKGIEKDG